VEAFWGEYPDFPTPPPCLAGTQAATQPNLWLGTPLSKRPAGLIQVEFFLFSQQGNVHLAWEGPDPLSSNTCTEDIFVYMSAFLFVENVHWIDLRLSEYQESGAVVAQHSFVLPRIESVFGNLPHVRAQIQNITSRIDTQTGLISHFRLSIEARQEIDSQAYNVNGTQPLIPYASSTPMALDPSFFVHNIMDYSW
jgi:hypothetical protein